MKRAPRFSEAYGVPLPPGERPEHHLTAASPEEYKELGKTFLAATRRRDSLSAAMLDSRIEHETEHAYAIEQVGGLAVCTLVVYRPEGILDRHHRFHVKTTVEGLEQGSPEYTVTTAYPTELSRNDQAYLDRRGLTVTDVDRMALEHGWHDLRPLSLHQGQQDGPNFPK